MDKYAKLEKIQELKDKSIITDEEFIIEKNKILNDYKEEVNTIKVQAPQVKNHLKSRNKKFTNTYGVVGLIICLLAIAVYQLWFHKISEFEEIKFLYVGVGLGLLAFIIGLVGLFKAINDSDLKKDKTITAMVLGLAVVILSYFSYQDLEKSKGKKNNSTKSNKERLNNGDRVSGSSMYD